MDFLLALTVIPSLGLTSWHFYLVFQRKAPARPLTISEHAVESRELLLAHKIAHTLPVVIFLPFVFLYLLPNGYNLAGLFLILASVFDSIEALALNKETARLDAKESLHYKATWIMAMSYLVYTTLISRIAGLNSFVYGSILAICFVLLYFAVNERHKSKFLFMQMTFFVLVALLGIIAHSTLLIQELSR